MELQLKDGKLIIEWWTPETADLACAVCGQCVGWRERTANPSLNLSLPPCPVCSIYCG